ncbi:MAG: acylphosphatase [Deltaproteobacteria bacterium]|nr:acylphosphatase [Deltaproteobacteria bacterium]
MKAIHFKVSGRVQGVWFRAHTRDAATKHGLRGWVRNLRDGRVEGWAEGTEPDLEALIAFLERGSPHARVEDLEVEWTEPEGHDTFKIGR